MSKVITEFQISKYRVLKMDELPSRLYKKIKIDDDYFIPVPTYDMPNCISIEYTGKCSFLQKSVEFL